MECLGCRSTAPPGGKFCTECGQELPRACPGCGAPVPAVSRFCSQCGAATSAGVTHPTTHAATAEQFAPQSAERRQLTVMFCDLVGSTVLATQLDPEELRDIISAYHGCVAATVKRFDGFVAKYMGDGVLVYFGYPRAREHEAECAVRTGLALLDSVGNLCFGAASLQVRVGIATGLVVVGDLVGTDEAQERGVVGETPNLAARLQGLATPGTVVIDKGTWQLTGGLFDYDDLGSVEAKGFPEPVRAFRVSGESTSASRFEALRSRQLPLIGREEELTLLSRRWNQAQNGEGQVILISGEPGIGKSRLVSTFEKRLQGECLRVSYFCSPHHSTSLLYPVIRQLEHASGFTRGDTDECKLNKLRDFLGTNAVSIDEVSALANILSLPLEHGNRLIDLAPQKRRELTLSALLAHLEALTKRKPVLMLWEDVHWIDSTSLELLDAMVQRVQSLPVLLVATSRPEFVAPWVGQARVSLMSLTRLESHQNVELAGHVAEGRALPPELLQEIIRRTDGVPLFVEELTRTVLESGMLREQDGHYVLADQLRPPAVPASLRASLMARLDRLGPARHIAQIGAAIGREFSYEFIASVAGYTGNKLDEALGELTRAELVYDRGRPPSATYVFKHALVQDTAYATLLKSTRRELHRRIVARLRGELSRHR